MREGCWELLGTQLGVTKGSRLRSGGDLEAGAPTPTPRGGQLLQTHSFLLSRDPLQSPCYMPPRGGGGQWCLQPPDMNEAFESCTPWGQQRPPGPPGLPSLLIPSRWAREGEELVGGEASYGPCLRD